MAYREVYRDHMIFSLKKYLYHLEVQLRYLMSLLYRKAGTAMLVFAAASLVLLGYCAHSGTVKLIINMTIDSHYSALI